MSVPDIHQAGMSANKKDSKNCVVVEMKHYPFIHENPASPKKRNRNGEVYDEKHLISAASLITANKVYRKLVSKTTPSQGRYENSREVEWKKEDQGGFLVTTVVTISANTVALGNLAVVIRGEGVLSTDENPIKAPTSDLWAISQELHTVFIPKKEQKENFSISKFEIPKKKRQKCPNGGPRRKLGLDNHPKLLISAQIDPDNRRARLIFGDASAADSGKYRCEIRIDEGELVFGNMFAYCKLY
ncbi:hypothetical protein NECAME_13828 [Necator americanus]|uniref:ZIG1/7 N-terminal domain-containing protein n=1 Tax=Necator americanus TaxID=51031 RepID=W2SRZ3_NECAM|nr:hypothetical protein NECAME_13828 [Necator americanus]ETN72519.1 hypothetical protein NECAME_13828 [Necator americanus]